MPVLLVLSLMFLAGCAATVDRSAQQAQLSSFISRCAALERAGAFTTTEAGMACWIKPARAMVERDGAPPLPVFDAYASEVLTLATLHDRGYLDDTEFLDRYRRANQNFASSSPQVERSPQTNTGTASTGVLITGAILGLLTSNPPSSPAMSIMIPPPPPRATPAINMGQWQR